MSPPFATPAPRLATLVMSLSLLAGCVAPGTEGTRPEITERGGENRTRQVSAPLLPSALFGGGAEEFIGWRCTPAQPLVTAHPDDELRLWSAHGAWRLTPAVVASGARYQQGEMSFWDRGDEAVVESPRGRLECHRDTARAALTRSDRPGVMLHGRGNEPGWTLSLPKDVPEVDLLLDYGERQLTLPYRVTAMDNDAGRVSLASGRADRPFELELEAAACFDGMSGKPYPVRVTLAIDGETYRGCGQGIAP